MTNILNTNTISTVAGFNGTTTSTYTLSPPSYSLGDSVISVNGHEASLTVKGKCIINGKDLEERLDNIEKVLGIPETDSAMFIKYPSLKKKYDEYINELAKLRTWDTLKG